MANVSECSPINATVLGQEQMNDSTVSVNQAVNHEGEGPASLSGASQEIVETIDTSAYARPEQKELLIFNLDFEEMAEAMFGEIDVVDQIMAEHVDETVKCSTDCIQQSAQLPSFLTSSDAFALNDNNLSNFVSHESVTDKAETENIKQDKKKEKSESNKKSKEEKSVDHILKSLNHLKTPEEKLMALGKKFVDITEEHKSLQHSFKLTERKNLQYLKEKEQLQTEHAKAILTRTRLESLCRELQRQNKAVKDESLMRVREEEEKRKEVSAKFQTTFNEVTNMMQDSNQKSNKLREENMELAQKLKTLIEQYELREQQVDKIIKHKELEVQLSEAKLAKSNMLLSEEREKLLQEKHQLLQELTEYQKRCHELTANEVQLRSQLSLYTDKYDEFQGTLNKSNEVFTHFKKEMDKMSKKIKKLEVETGTWRSRWENSNKALLEMAAEKQQRDIEYVNITRKLLQLEKLCRALQTERKVLLSQLKNNKDIPENEIAQLENAQDKEIESSLKEVGSENISISGIQPENENTTLTTTQLEPLPLSIPLLNDGTDPNSVLENESKTSATQTDTTELPKELHNTPSDSSQTEGSNNTESQKPQVPPSHDLEKLDNISHNLINQSGKTEGQTKAKDAKGKKKHKSAHK